jgi:hypothetical protein
MLFYFLKTNAVVEDDAEQKSEKKTHTHTHKHPDINTTRI